MTALADTSLFVARDRDRPLRAEPPSEIAVSVVTVGELRLGVLLAPDVAARERRLATYTLAAGLQPLPIDRAVANAWGALVARLREAGTRMPINDSWIAATALAHGMDLATQDDDYDAVPGLRVIKL